MSLVPLRNNALPSGTISKFINIRPPPITAIYNVDHPSRPQPPVTNVLDQCQPSSSEVVRTGRELARMFENETPGLLHRHALNCLLFGRDVSPPRQARIWMALDVAIYSALHAAWYYKWSSDRPFVSYRRRPYEYAPSLNVLYDVPVSDDGSGDDPANVPPCPPPTPSPGSPRHPAYPSGHSTYSAAASRILEHFFPDEQAEIQKLADNIGEARIWGGVHWRTDHTAGQTIGRAVAEVILAQLGRDAIPAFAPCNPHLNPAPSQQEVREEAYGTRAGCLGSPPAGEVIPPPMSGTPATGTQQGAR